METNSVQSSQSSRPTASQKSKQPKPSPTPVPIGLDVGYGFVKVVTPDSRITFPSLVAPVNSSDLMLPFCQPEELVAVQGQRYLVGQPAIKSTFRFRDQWDSWWYSPAFTALLAKAKSVIPKGAIIVSGLPLHTYNSENAQQINDIIGTHLHAKTTRTVAQGLGAYFALATSKPEYTNAKIILVDIGSRTTELIALSASRCIPQQCRGLVLGTQSLFSQLADDLSKQYGRNTDPFEVEHAIIEHTPLVIRTTTLQPSDLIKHLTPLFEDFLTRIHQEMVSLWGIADLHNPTSVAPDFDHMVFTGGGARLLKNLILARYPHAVIPDQPQASNAYGFFLLAKSLIPKEEREHKDKGGQS
ncbi:MAG: ParM/StbA family protein [Nitrospirae bacterium]|nr:MAG: ParM/StbA family protein [Nitrospirota bacterium]